MNKHSDNQGALGYQFRYDRQFLRLALLFREAIEGNFSC